MARFTSLPPELFEHISSLLPDLLALRLVSREAAAKVLRPYTLAHFSHKSVLLADHRSLHTALTIAHHPALGSALHTLSLFVNGFVPGQNPLAMGMLCILLNEMKRRSKKRLTVRICDDEETAPRPLAMPEEGLPQTYRSYSRSDALFVEIMDVVLAVGVPLRGLEMRCVDAYLPLGGVEKWVRFSGLFANLTSLALSIVPPSTKEMHQFLQLLQPASQLRRLALDAKWFPESSETVFECLSQYQFLRLRDLEVSRQYVHIRQLWELVKQNEGLLSLVLNDCVVETEEELYWEEDLGEGLERVLGLPDVAVDQYTEDRYRLDGMR